MKKDWKFYIQLLSAIILAATCGWLMFSCQPREEHKREERGLEWNTPELIYESPTSGDKVFHIPTSQPGYLYVIEDKTGNIKTIAVR